MNNRVFTRFDFTIAATLYPENGENFTGEISNISLYGIFFKPSVEREIATHKPIRMTMEIIGLKFEFQLDCQATIAHVSDAGMGINIEGLSVNSFILWKNFLAYASSDSDVGEKELGRYIRQHLIEKKLTKTFS